MSSRPSRNTAASVKQRLLNLAVARGEDFNFLLTRYAQVDVGFGDARRCDPGDLRTTADPFAQGDASGVKPRLRGGCGQAASMAGLRRAAPAGRGEPVAWRGLGATAGLSHAARGGAGPETTLPDDVAAARPLEKNSVGAVSPTAAAKSAVPKVAGGTGTLYSETL